MINEELKKKDETKTFPRAPNSSMMVSVKDTGSQKELMFSAWWSVFVLLGVNKTNYALTLQVHAGLTGSARAHCDDL